MIVVLDTNVLVRAAFRRKADSDNLLERASRGEFEIAISNALLEELGRTLVIARLERWYQWLPGESARFLDQVRRVANRVDPDFELKVVRDPSDNRVIEAALAAEAQLIVTTDGDLLDLNEYEGIEMVTEAQFLAILREAL